MMDGRAPILPAREIVYATPDRPGPAAAWQSLPHEHRCVCNRRPLSYFAPYGDWGYIANVSISIG